MSDDHSARGSRAFRVVGGSLASLAGLAVLAYLVVAGVLAYMFGVALPRHQHKIDDESLASARSSADQSQQMLASAAADGKLSDREITQVFGMMWTIERSADRWRMTTRTPAGTEQVCFRFDITLPLGPGTRVTHTELPACPPIGPHPDAS